MKSHGRRADADWETSVKFVKYFTRLGAAPRMRRFDLART